MLSVQQPARPNELMKKEKGWLTDVGNNLEWRMKCSTCSTSTEIRKHGIIHTSLAVALEKIKNLAHVVEGGHHQRKRHRTSTLRPVLRPKSSTLILKTHMRYSPTGSINIWSTAVEIKWVGHKCEVDIVKSSASGKVDFTPSIFLGWRTDDTQL